MKELKNMNLSSMQMRKRKSYKYAHKHVYIVFVRQDICCFSGRRFEEIITERKEQIIRRDKKKNSFRIELKSSLKSNSTGEPCKRISNIHTVHNTATVGLASSPEYLCLCGHANVPGPLNADRFSTIRFVYTTIIRIKFTNK